MPVLSCCTELLSREGKDFAAQCRFAKEVGYGAVELAVESLPGDPRHLAMADIRAMRRIAESEGLAIAGLHWLLSDAPSLSITDPTREADTVHYLTRLVEITAELGGKVLIHGSPKQRVPLPDTPMEAAYEQAAKVFMPVAKACCEAGLLYAIEPLSRDQTPFINTLAEAAHLTGMVGSPHFMTMIDCSSAALAEQESVPTLIRDWVPTGQIAHIHLNDSNRGAPGTGNDDFAAIAAAIFDSGYDGFISVEPFVTRVNAEVTLAIAAATMRAHLGTPA